LHLQHLEAKSDFTKTSAATVLPATTFDITAAAAAVAAAALMATIYDITATAGTADAALVSATYDTTPASAVTEKKTACNNNDVTATVGPAATLL
jgi:hypothetical protein